MVAGFQWSLLSAVLLSVQAARCPRTMQGLSCVNDFVKSVSCTWKHAAFSPGLDCWLSGIKVTYVRRQPKHIIRSCKLRQQGELPGCTFSFDRILNSYEKLLNISASCNNTVFETIPHYCPEEHIKMHPPGTPNVSSSVNMTHISWNPGNPRSEFITSYNFQVHIKHRHQSWNEVEVKSTADPEMPIWQKLTGHNQVRVRVKPGVWERSSHWSDWSQVTSWTAHDDKASSHTEALNPSQTSLFLHLTLAFSFGLLAASLMVLFRCWNKRFNKEKTVPNPSNYFCTLHSIYGGNLKRWLKPVSVPDSFFVSHPCEDISVVQVCEAWDVVPSASSCSTSALLHPCPADNPHSSCSSSCFSNMGYFMSSSSSSSSRTRTSPYFSYQGDQSTHRTLQLSLCPAFISSISKTLHMEPQSPDSGFGLGRFEDRDVGVTDDNQSSPLLLPLPLSVSPSPPASPSFPSDVDLAFDYQGLEEDTLMDASPVVSGNLSAWPVSEPMSRASSLPVDTSKSGYLTLKELQTTFSNKSI